PPGSSPFPYTTLFRSMLGASVAICGRDRAALERVAAELEKLGARAFFHITDVTDAKQVSALVAEADAALGSINILVNNAGMLIEDRKSTRLNSSHDQI